MNFLCATGNISRNIKLFSFAQVSAAQIPTNFYCHHILLRICIMTRRVTKAVKVFFFSFSKDRKGQFSSRGCRSRIFFFIPLRDMRLTKMNEMETAKKVFKVYKGTEK